MFSRDGYNYSFDKSLENIIVNTVINVVWTPIDYTITYKNVDGLTNDNPATYNVESSKIDLKSVNKTDYSFLGWYDGDDKITSIEAKTKENITLEARFDRSTKLNYTVKADNTVRINGVDASIDRSTIEEIYIPRVYAGYDVSEIGNYAFSGCSCLTSIAIPNSVTNLGYGIVQNCKALKSVALPNSITSLENYSFYNCSSLTSVTIPDKVTSIGISAFYNCGLTSVAIPDSVETIDEGAFSCCKKLTSVTLPKNITSIGKAVFNGCAKLTSITIPDKVTSIGESAFSFCYKLTNVSLSNSLTSIGDSAFLNCFKLTSITIPNSVTSIGDSAFQSCYILANVTLSNRLASIGTKAFQSCFNLASITIPNSVTSIGDSAFNYCHKLIEVYNLSSSLEIEKGSDENGHVGYYAKAIHTNATDESILFNVGDYTFAYDGTTYYLVSYQGNDTKLTLPSNFVYKESTITSYEIYNYAFYEFADLTSVIIPNSVTSIGNSAFSYCYKLIEVYNLNSSLEIEKGKDISGSVGYYAKAIHTNATDESILFNAGDYTFAYDGETCYLYSYNGNGTKLTLPSSVDYKGKTITKYEIYQYSFENCPSLTSVIIPASVNAIRSYAFRDCINITSITIGENVINMDSSSLENCDSIETGIIQSSEMANIVYSHKAGRLAEKATKIYIKSDITTIGSYITDNFDKASSTVEIEGISYYLYTLK